MEWLWIPALLAALVVGFVAGANAASKQVRHTLKMRLSEWAQDRNNFLRILRRELANHLMQVNAPKFAQGYDKLHYELIGYKDYSKERLEAERKVLCEKFPLYADFDLIGTREHILYPDAFSMEDFDDVLEHYKNIARFQALNVAVDEMWQHINPVSESDRKHLHEYVERVADSRLIAKLKEAINIYYLARNKDESGFDYECRDFSVVMVPHIAEIRYGVHFKKTDEFGMYSSFHGDRDEPYIGYYATDSQFDNERRLFKDVTSYERTT